MLESALLTSPWQATAPTLHIALLGPPTLVSDGQPVPIARRQSRALLYRIAAAPQPVPRDHLCFLLWPDSPEATARRNLTVVLTQLRHALPSPDTFVLADDAIGFHPACVTIDTAQFAVAAQHALRDGQLDALADAVQLYRGPFLHGFALPATEFSAWADQERQSWERRYLDALAALVEGYAAAHAYQNAIAAAQRALETDELAEGMHRHLIALYAASGNRTAALRQYERCVVALERELGVGPLPETRAVYEAVRDGQAPLLSHPSAQAQQERALGARSLPPGAGVAPEQTQPAHATLPAPATALLGRQDELAAVCALLGDPDVRLLTVCGPGGSGKTRLALQAAWDVAERFADGVVFVPLAPLRNGDLVIDAIAQACGLHEIRGLSSLDALRKYVRDKHLLLVLDNFEHLLGAATAVAGLLAEAPGLQVLVTSRTLLHLLGEHTFSVPPLPLPDLTQLPPPDQLAEQPAVALLLARARAYVPALQLNAANAADIAAICVQLDGLPLAIELAAAQLKMLSPQALRRRLGHRLALLNHGPRDLPDRQRTLRATIDWSYRLLNLPEQRLLARLAVFAGGWALDAAEEICAVNEASHSVFDGMATLLDSHLLFQASSPDHEMRFGMLETIREYALERLRDHADEWAVRGRHAAYFRRLVERCASRWQGDEFLVALGELDRDYNNVRVALHWLDESAAHEAMAHMVSALHDYWDTYGLMQESHAWTTQVLRAAEALPPPLHARLRNLASFLAYRQGNLDEALRLAATVASDPQATAQDNVQAANVTGLVALDSGNIVSARQHFEHALAIAQQHGLLCDVAGVQFNLGVFYLTAGQFADAETLFQASDTEAQHPRFHGGLSTARGFIALLRGNHAQAAELLQAGLQQHGLVRNTLFQLYGLLACCGLAMHQRQPICAVTLFSAATHQADSRSLALSQSILAMIEPLIERARSAIAADAFGQAWQRGRSLSLDGAIALAQSLLSSSVSPLG